MGRGFCSANSSFERRRRIALSIFKIEAPPQEGLFHFIELDYHISFYYFYSMTSPIFNTDNIRAYQKQISNSFLFKLGLMKDLPLASLIGVKIVRLTEEECSLTVPYRFINKNPFKTTYWAVMGMAAEMASGLLLLMYTHKLKPSVSTFVIGCEAKFVKRAIGKTTFKCLQGEEIAEKIAATVATFEPQEIRCITNAYNEQGELVAEFIFTWGIKARSEG